MPAYSVGVAFHGDVGAGDLDLYLKLSGFGEYGVAGLPAPFLEVLDDEDLGHVAHCHPVTGVLVRGVGEGYALVGVRQGAEAFGGGYSERREVGLV